MSWRKCLNCYCITNWNFLAIECEWSSECELSSVQLTVRILLFDFHQLVGWFEVWESNQTDSLLPGISFFVTGKYRQERKKKRQEMPFDDGSRQEWTARDETSEKVTGSWWWLNQCLIASKHVHRAPLSPLIGHVVSICSLTIHRIEWTDQLICGVSPQVKSRSQGHQLPPTHMPLGRVAS